MATIKLQNGNVILKDGKVSCECCGAPDCAGPISGEGVFEISKQEYDRIYRGGTWNISFNGSIQESGTTTENLRPAGREATAEVVGGGSASFNVLNSCSSSSSGGIGSGIYSTSLDGSSSSATVKGSYAFSFQLGTSDENDDKKYFVKYSVSINMYYIFFTTSCNGTSYPTNPASINSSSLSGCNKLSSGNFGPTLNDPVYFSGYSRSTSTSINISLS